MSLSKHVLVVLSGKLKFEIQRDGKVVIEGIITEGTFLLQGSSRICQMSVQQIHSSGPFSITFNLPGPVDPRLVLPRFDPEGFLEVVVMRYTGVKPE